MTEYKELRAIEQPRLRDALERVRPQLEAIPESALLQINLDPLAAAAVVRGALPGLMAMRPILAAEVKSFDLIHLDRLETYALALIQADTICKGITDKPQLLAPLSTEAYALRARLLADATILVRRGHIPEPRLSKLRGPNGYQNIASDILTLAGLLRDSWATIANRTAIQESELDRAEVLGDQLIDAIGMREQLTSMAAEAALQRQRAYTLFIGAYDEVRSALIFQRRHEGDANKIAPSLYGKRKARRKKPESTADAADTLKQASLTPSLGGVAAATDAAPARRVGMPGSDPFLH